MGPRSHAHHGPVASMKYPTGAHAPQRPERTTSRIQSIPQTPLGRPRTKWGPREGQGAWPQGLCQCGAHYMGGLIGGARWVPRPTPKNHRPFRTLWVMEISVVTLVFWSGLCAGVLDKTPFLPGGLQ
jgi:hypothetical protein